MRNLQFLSVLTTTITIGSTAHSQDSTSRPFVCNATDKVDFVEGLGDLLRLPLALLAELGQPGYFSMCWTNISWRLFETGTLSYYLGVFLPVWAIAILGVVATIVGSIALRKE